MAASHRFHPDHDELHGMTVVLFTSGPFTYLGRWDAQREGRIHLTGACVHQEGQGPQDRDHFLAEARTYGFAVQHGSLMVPRSEVTRIVRLADLA